MIIRENIIKRMPRENPTNANKLKYSTFFVFVQVNVSPLQNHYFRNECKFPASKLN